MQGMDPSINSKSHYKLQYITEMIENEFSYVPIFAGVESWCNEFNTDAQLHIQNYQFLRSDRKHRNRGGAFLYIHNNLPTSNVNKFDNSVCEAVMCTINSVNTIVASVYRPPDTEDESFRTMIKYIQNYIDAESKSKHKTVLIFGDFNLPCIRWPNTTVSTDHYSSKNMLDCAETLLEFINTNFLSQYVDQPTRKSSSQNYLLDLVLTNDINMVKHIKTEDTKLSDHKMITMKSTFGLKHTAPTKPTFTPHTFRNLNLYKANFAEINKNLQAINWDELKSICALEDYPELVRLTVLQVCEMHSPVKCHRSTRLSSYKRQRRTLSRKKRKQMKLLQNEQLQPPEKLKIKEKLVKIHDEIKLSINNEAIKSEKEAITKIHEDPRYFFNFSKRKLKCKSSVGPLVDQDGVLKFDDESMSNILQDQFCSVFSDPCNPNKKLTNINATFEEPLEHIQLTSKDIDNAIKKIKINTSSSTDDIPAIVFNKCRTSLNYPSLQIWQDSLDSGFIDPQFKEQIIIPLHKKGSKDTAANYRPVCPTAHSIKICERSVANKILNHLVKNNLLCKNQHGFLPNRNCLTQLLGHINVVLENFLLNKDTDSVYLDYAKAFDKVDHEILIHKLHSYGIRGKLLEWIKSFLSNRFQCVSVNGVKSYLSKVKSGVPQGTVLGPLLFLIYINDINCCIKNSLISSFADDTRVKKSISSTADVNLLQDDLNNTIVWSKNNNMLLHEQKFEYLNHSTGQAKLLKELPFTTQFYQYITPNGSIISPSNCVRDLGVLITPDISWTLQIDSMIDSASKMISWIHSVFQSRDEETMMILYKSLVRSRLEYACPLWCPSKVEDIIKIESLQRHFTSRIEGYTDLHYWERLSELKLMSLQRRRERYCILHLYKIIIDAAPNDLNINHYTHPRRGLCVKVPPLTPHAKTKFQTLYDSSFVVLAPRLFNSLPKSVRAMDTFPKFKAALTRHLLSIPDEPPVQGIPSSNSLLQRPGHHGRLEMGR